MLSYITVLEPLDFGQILESIQLGSVSNNRKTLIDYFAVGGGTKY